MKFRISVILIFLLLSARSLAQEEIFPSDRYGFFATGISFQMFQVGDLADPVSQASFPMTILLPIGNRFNLTVSHTPALSWWYEGSRLYGLSDTWIQGSYLFWDEKAMFNLGIGIPTGKTRLNRIEYELTLFFLSRNIYRFRVPVYGQGLCGKAGLALAIPVTEGIVLGVGGQYLYRTPYHPVRYVYGDEVGLEPRIWDDEYRTGDQISGQLGIDYRISENTKIMLDGIYTYYWPDLRNGKEVYGSGEKVNFIFGFFHQFDDRFILSNVVFRQKGKNELLQGLSLQRTLENQNGFQTEIDVVFKLLHMQNGGIFILGDGRYYGKNAMGTNGAGLFGGGFGANLRFEEKWVFDMNIKFIFGKLMSYTDEPVQGLDVYIGMKYEF